MSQITFSPIPSGAVLARYVQVSPGVYAVVTVSGKVLAASFFDLREQFEPLFAINGAGGWVVMAPRSSSSSQPPASPATSGEPGQGSLF